MVVWPRFPNAPITEALLDVRIKLPSFVDLSRLATFQDAVEDRYPQRRERSSWQAGFQIKDGSVEVMRPSGRPDGYLFTSADGRQMVQARLDGFTFNRLKPYDKWKPWNSSDGLRTRFSSTASPKSPGSYSNELCSRGASCSP
ncbi:MAG: TIGR04255 family protein [Candidatus Rokubacteria bacterium]|nr:TIGR04255 family protein [Candidatus Rokubacteria bacterium]